MSQNTSSAVMAQRIEPPDSFDDFPTPCWGTRALMEHVIKPRALTRGRVQEPACNRGYMVRALRDYFDSVYASDIFDYTTGPTLYVQDRVVDFLWAGTQSPVLEINPPDWVITNPPFKLAEQFIAQAREVARVGVAMLVRTSFLEGGGRYERLFSVNPPSIIAQFAERLILTKGIVRDPNLEYWDEETQKMRRPSTATAYAWLIWVRDLAPQPFQWIPPCRTLLERPGDYPTL